MKFVYSRLMVAKGQTRFFLFNLCKIKSIRAFGSHIQSVMVCRYSLAGFWCYKGKKF